MDRSSHGSYQVLEHYFVRNSEVEDMQVDEIFLSGINVELVSMEEC